MAASYFCLDGKSKRASRYGTDTQVASDKKRPFLPNEERFNYFRPASCFRGRSGRDTYVERGETVIDGTAVMKKLGL
jgi:hypothetical protein